MNPFRPAAQANRGSAPGPVPGARRCGRRAWRLAAASVLLCASACIGAAEAPRAAAGISLGVFPYAPPRAIAELWGPVAADLQAALGLPVSLKSTSSFATFSAEVLAGQYDIAQIQPFDYHDAVEKGGYVPLARIDAPLVAELMVREDSSHRSLESLRGTTIALPPQESANARMVLRSLAENNLLPGRDVVVRHFNSHDSCLAQVWTGAASACGTSNTPVQVFERRMQAKLRSVYATPALPHALLIVHPRVPLAQREAMQARIVGWSKVDSGRYLLRRLGFPGYVVAGHSDYEVMREYQRASTQPSRAEAAQTGALTGALNFGVQPFVATPQLAKNFAPALASLADAAGMPLHLRSAGGYAAFSAALAGQAYDVAFVQPFEVARAETFGYLALAAMQQRPRAAFFVRADSRYREVADLKGQAVAMGPPESPPSRLARRVLLQAGLKPGLNVTVDHRRSLDSCLQQLQRQAVEACAVSDIMAQLMPHLVKGTRVVGVSESIPGAVFMAHRRVDAGIRSLLQARIVSWKSNDEGRRVLSALALGDFGEATIAEYRRLAASGEGR